LPPLESCAKCRYLHHLLLLLLRFSVVVAGHETTAAVLTWALFCVVQNPEVEAKLLAEIDAAVGDRAPGVRGNGFCVVCMQSYTSPMAMSASCVNSCVSL
jgi:cytochrome P450